MTFFSIGVYGTTEQSFFNKLVAHGITTFCDIRNRRGVRGSKYSYVNSKKLQAKLQELGIRYLYVPALAPTREIRSIQQGADKNEQIKKSQRQELSPSFKMAYKNEILDKFDFDGFIKGFPATEQKVVLFCVEAEPDACHRSLVIQKLHEDFDYSIEHI